MEIYVSPDGHDRWSGRMPEPNTDRSDGPLRTLRRARDVAREVTRRDSGIDIRLRGETYRLKETLVLGPSDSGSEGAAVTWRNYDEEQPVVSGARAITGWQPADQARPLPEQVPDETIPHLWVADLPVQPGTESRPWRFHVLYDSSGALTRAAIPDIDYDPDREADPRTLPFRPGSLEKPRSLELVDISMAASHNFAWHILPVEEIDNDRGLLKTGAPAGYPLKRTRRRLGDPDARLIRLENVPAGLTEPGTWWLNAADNRVYLWPRNGEPPTDIEAPVLTELVRVEGHPDRGEIVHHVSFDGITFRRGERMVMRDDRLSLQHDWEWQNERNAMVRFTGAENVTVRNCRFHESGSAGIRLDLHAQRNRVEDSVFHDLGGTGIVLAGYGPGTRDANRQNVIAHNHLYRVGQQFRACSGIFLSQSSDNRISDNLLHDMPYAAIVLSGPRTFLFDTDDPRGDYEGGRTIDETVLKPVPLRFEHHLGFIHSRYNVVEHNEIHDVMLALGDGNAIYLSGTGNGNVVRRNYVHDLLGNGLQSAIRTDGWQWYTRIHENVIWRVNAGALTVKQINDYDNNFIVDCRRFGCILARRSPGGEAWGSTVRRNILYQPSADIDDPKAYPPFYEECGEMADGIHGKLEHLVIDDNILYCAEDNSVAETVLKRVREEMDRDHRSRAVDPGFVDPENGDFRLREDSPAKKLGIRPIEHWGIRPKTSRPSEETTD